MKENEYPKIFDDIENFESSMNITNGTYTLKIILKNGSEKKFSTSNQIEWENYFKFERDFQQHLYQKIQQENLNILPYEKG